MSKNGVALKPGLDRSMLYCSKAFSYLHSIVTMTLTCIVFEIKLDILDI